VQSSPKKPRLSSRPAGNAANVTSAVGMEETFGRVRARRTSLFTKTVMWITGLVCTAFLLGTLAQAWSNSNLMVQLQAEQQTLSQAQAEHNRLEQAADHYKDPAVIEDEARQQLGYVRPGEQPVIIIDAGNQAQTTPQLHKGVSQQQSYWQDWWQIFFSSGNHK
jgi:cell division protein FtsB